MSRPEILRRVDALGQFRVTDCASPVLSDADSHHLHRVLRARDGEEIVVTDGAGSFSITRVAGGALERVSEVMHDAPLSPLEVYLAPLKGDRSEWALAKAVELGATRIVPLLSDRVVVRWRGEAGRKMLSRWRRIALESAGQCRRTWDAVVADPVSPSEVPDHVAVCDIGAVGSLDGVWSLAVGPEGGWAPGEWSDARRRVGLGEQVLRAETAAVVAVAMLASTGPGWPRRTLASPSDKDERG